MARRKIEETVYFFDSPGKNDDLYEPLPPETGGKWRTLYEWFSSIAVSFVIIFLIFTFVFRAVGVSGSSMIPTLNDKDWLAVTNINYMPQRGDIVVVTQPNALNEPIIKRVIAVGGDTIDINFKEGVVILNGEELSEPYVNTPTNKQYDLDFPMHIPEGYVFVMGDNRNGSLDSRSSVIGLIDERYILGKVAVRLYPFSKIQYK